MLGIIDAPFASQRYLGRNLREAAEALRPGTVSGIGESPEHAIARANTVKASVLEGLRNG